MQHSFNIGIASDCGIEAAVLLNNIIFWCEKNRANEENYFDGRYWTYNTISAWQELFKYMKPKTVRSSLEKLRETGYVITGNFNKKGYDRTLWYAPTGKALALYGITICPDRQKELPVESNGFAPEGEPIPVINTDNNPDINTDKGKRTSHFTRPTRDMVKDYYLELEASGTKTKRDWESFCDHFESNGWKVVGKAPMIDWKAAVRNWIRRDFGSNRAAPSDSFEDKRERAHEQARRQGLI